MTMFDKLFVVYYFNIIPEDGRHCTKALPCIPLGHVHIGM